MPFRPRFAFPAPRRTVEVGCRARSEGLLGDRLTNFDDSDHRDIASSVVVGAKVKRWYAAGHFLARPRHVFPRSMDKRTKAT